MAAITPTSVTLANFGSLNGHIATFANTADDGDTWASGISNIVAVIPIQFDGVTTQASAGIGYTLSGSTITIILGEDNTAVKLIVLSGSTQ